MSKTYTYAKELEINLENSKLEFYHLPFKHKNKTVINTDIECVEENNILKINSTNHPGKVVRIALAENIKLKINIKNCEFTLKHGSINELELTSSNSIIKIKHNQIITTKFIDHESVILIKHNVLNFTNLELNKSSLESRHNVYVKLNINDNNLPTMIIFKHDSLSGCEFDIRTSSLYLKHCVFSKHAIISALDITMIHSFFDNLNISNTKSVTNRHSFIQTQSFQ